MVSYDVTVISIGRNPDTKEIGIVVQHPTEKGQILVLTYDEDKAPKVVEGQIIQLEG